MDSQFQSSMVSTYVEMHSKTRGVFRNYKERFGTRSIAMLFLEESWKPQIVAAKMKRGLTEEQGRCEYNAVIRQFLDPILPSEHAGYLNAWAKLERTYAVRATEYGPASDFDPETFDYEEALDQEPALLLEVLKEADAEFATFKDEYRERQVKAKLA
jgi:hypothetical protein